MNLFFRDGITTITTVLLIGLIAYMIFLVRRRKQISAWGRRTLLLFGWGLLICITAATRDSFHLSEQHAIDGSTAPGLFSLVSIPSVVGMIGAAVIVLSGLLSLFLRRQEFRRTLCFTMMSGIVLKIVVIEIARILL